jgi:Fe-S cluster assembly iron-binding protein IscA
VGLAQDEPNEDDKVFTQEGIIYIVNIVNKDLFEQVRPIEVDFIDTPRGSGFFIFSNLGKGSSSKECC